MTTGDLMAIPGSYRSAWPGATESAAVEPRTPVLLTAWLRPAPGGELDVARALSLAAAPPANRTYADRAELRRMTAADPADVELVRAYCARFGLEIAATHWRSVVIRGPLAAAAEAFGATVATCVGPDKQRFRQRSGSLHAPRAVAAVLRGVFGLEQWPRSRALGALHPHTVPLAAREIAARYAFSEDMDGSGQTVGVLQLRGTFKPDDFTACMKAQGSAAALPVHKRIDDAELGHAEETAKDVESAIDTQIVGALAPGARIVVYAAPDSERGVLDAIRTALFDEEYAPAILSISFGLPELVWTPAALTLVNELFVVAATIGVSVFCASGDNGAELDYDGKPHVVAPASSPFALACGATAIGGEPPAEAAWERSGGGFSEHFPAPAWQAAAVGGAAGRGVPDVSAQVRPGYPVVFDGTPFAMGGTSAVAPLWAALTARINQRLGKAAGFFAPLLYADPRAALREIVTGANDRYAASAGWNPVTGLGVPDGAGVACALQAPRADQKPTQPSASS